MKKFLVAIASLAMLMGLVSCDLLGPVEFSAQALVIKNDKTNNTAYWIDGYDIKSGSDVISVYLDDSAGSSGDNKGQWTLTVTSKKPGSASLYLYSEECAKLAMLNITVSDSGYILGLGKLYRMTYYTTENGFDLESPWKDYPGKIDPKIDPQWYEYDADNIIYVNGDIIYSMHKNSSLGSSEIWYWRRGIIVQTNSGVIDYIDWDTKGKFQRTSSSTTWYRETLYEDSDATDYPVISLLKGSNLSYDPHENYVIINGKNFPKYTN